jgi:hypothetical protein
MTYRLVPWLLLLSIWLAPLGWAAPSKQYAILESTIFFGDSAQTPTAQITLSALASGDGQISAQHDRGTGARAAWFILRCRCALTGTNVVGEPVEYYIATSDGNNIDGEVGTADADLATAKRNNLTRVLTLLVDQTTTNTVMTASTLVFVPARYVSIGVWNGTSLPFQTSTTTHRCTLVPWALEQQ